MKRLLTIIAALVLLAPLSEAQPPEPAAETFANPLWKGADPWIVKHDGMYYTCQVSGRGIEVSWSRLMTSKQETRVVWRCPEGAWNSYQVWAPELHFIGGKWYIYYTAGDIAAGPPVSQRAGVLVCDTPMGDYRDLGMLYTGDDPGQLRDNIWAIDMTVFEHRGQLYAVWSGWKQQRDTMPNDQYLYIAPMENPWTIGRRRLLASPALPWERDENMSLTEGPTALRHGDDLFIVYSTQGASTADYKMGLLRLRAPGNDPLDPASWIKSDKPVFQGGDTVFGVGHASFTTSPDDTEWWVCYHTKTDRQPGWSRVVHMQPFVFDADGSPAFGQAVAAGVQIPRPSGEIERAKH